MGSWDLQPDHENYVLSPSLMFARTIMRFVRFTGGAFYGLPSNEEYSMMTAHIRDRSVIFIT